MHKDNKSNIIKHHINHIKGNLILWVSINLNIDKSVHSQICFSHLLNPIVLMHRPIKLLTYLYREERR